MWPICEGEKKRVVLELTMRNVFRIPMGEAGQEEEKRNGDDEIRGFEEENDKLRGEIGRLRKENSELKGQSGEFVSFPFFSILKGGNGNLEWFC